MWSVFPFEVAGAVVLAEGCLESRHLSSGVARRRLWAAIDPELAKAWLSYCEKEHTILESKPALPAHMRVVDLQTGCLVDVPIACRYVTLSHVWGGPQKFCLRQSSKTDLYQAGSISPHNGSLPWTIRDFLTFVSAIGERYAWVDSLCIVQDDAKDVQQYVCSMHTIYENAVVTIVAAAGNSADAGLSGLRPETRRSMQGREIIHRVAYGAPLPPLEEVIEHSPWKQRGWTYQEDILSRRMIFFTDCQMHFKCIRGCTACEETWEDGHVKTKGLTLLDLPKEERMHAYRPNLLTRKTTTDVHHGMLNSLGWWNVHVREVCRRKTTEPKDRLHAVEGILQYMKSMFDGHEFVWGHPTSALEVSLLWRPGNSKSEVSRNNAVDNTGVRIPSWSLAGWTGPISWRHFNICETAHSEVTWIDVNESNTANAHRFKVRTCGAPSQQWLEENGWQRHFVHEDMFPYYLKQGSEDIRYQHPITFARDQGPLRAVNMSTGEINFFAQSACFRMPAQHIEKRANIDSELDHCPNIRHLCLFDENEHVVSVVLADPQVLRRLKQETFECIAVVNTTLSRVEWDACYLEAEKRFMHITDWPEVAPSEVSSYVEWEPELVDKDIHWDFYDSCWQSQEEFPTCPYYSLKERGTICVSPFDTINPSGGPFPFDPRYYSPWRPWPLYEVILVERQGDIVFRIGVGFVHVDAWDKVAVEKHVRLR